MLFSVGLFIAGSSPLAAQTTATSGMNITLDEVERRALERNPRIAEARLATDAGDYAVAESRAAFTPNLSLSMTQRSQANASTSQLAGGQVRSPTTR